MRLFGLSIDTPGQNAAMVQKLRLPFPLLSDPDRSRAIQPLGLSDPKDERQIAKPAMVLFRSGGDETWRFVSRDFADRLPEADALAAAEDLGLDSTTQEPAKPGDPAPGPRAMRLEEMPTYFRAVRFAALAMGLRHGHRDEAIKEDSKAYVAEMDRFSEATKALIEGSG